jgi:hypothetical protein
MGNDLICSSNMVVSKNRENPSTMKSHGGAHEFCPTSGVKATAGIPTISLVGKKAQQCTKKCG